MTAIAARDRNWSMVLGETPHASLPYVAAGAAPVLNSRPALGATLWSNFILFYPGDPAFDRDNPLSQVVGTPSDTQCGTNAKIPSHCVSATVDPGSL